MSSFSTGGGADEAPDLICQLDSVQGMVDTLTSVRWKHHQDAVVEISEHGIVLIVEETGCLQAKVYLKREVFGANKRNRFSCKVHLVEESKLSLMVSGMAQSSHI